MKHRLLTILSAISLLLCVAVVVMWVRSYWTHDSVLMLRPGAPTDGLPVVRAWGVAQSRGKCFVGSHLREADMTAWTRVGPLYHLQLDDVDLPIWDTGFAAGLGFKYNRWRDGWAVLFPTWFAALATAMGFAAFALPSWRRRRAGRKSRIGLCPSCGYDLRATPGCCPECGAVPDFPGRKPIR